MTFTASWGAALRHRWPCSQATRHQPLNPLLQVHPQLRSEMKNGSLVLPRALTKGQAPVELELLDSANIFDQQHEEVPIFDSEGTE